MEDIFVLTGSYVAIFIVCYILFNYLSKGFLAIFLKVKASRGKKVLIRVHDVTDLYYRAGRFKKKVLHFKDRNGEKHQNASVKADDIYRHLGVNCLDYDLVSSAVITPRYEKIEGMDSSDVDDLVQRALMLKNLDNKDRQILIIGLVVLAILILGGFYIMNGTLTEILSAVNSLKVGVV